jgi:hypothetical protein
MGNINSVEYPDVTVQLTGQDGNAFAIIAAVAGAIRRTHGAGAASAWAERAMESESYDALLVLCQDTVHVL